MRTHTGGARIQGSELPFSSQPTEHGGCKYEDRDSVGGRCEEVDTRRCVVAPGTTSDTSIRDAKDFGIFTDFSDFLPE